jgi:hypothetical protein
LIKPKNDFHFWVNVIYSPHTMLSVYLVRKSYRKNESFATTIYPGFIMIIVRMPIRVADFERTKPTMTDIEWGEFEMLQ